MKSLAAISLFLIFVPMPRSSFAQTVQPKPIVDGTGIFGKALIQRLSTDPDGRQKKNIYPFVIGYCGWRVRALTLYSMTKYEGMQLGLCKTILDFFDPQITPTLSAIETRAISSTAPVEVTAAEAKAIQDYVVMKYGMFYLGISDDLSTKQDPVARWKYYAGTNLGELAAHLTIWWRIWTEPKFDAKVGSLLASLGEEIDSAPKNSDPAFIVSLKGLQLLGAKTKFTPTERAQINQLLTNALQASVGLSSLPNIGEAVPTGPAFTRNISPSPSQEKTAAEILESAKVRTTKQDFRGALAELDQAIKLSPGNGLAYFQRALVKEKLGLADDAIKDYNAVILLRVSLKEAHFNRGTIYLNKKEFRSAIADLNIVVALDPKSDAAFYNRGLAFYNSQQLFAALGDFTTAIKLRPLNANGYLMRSYIYCAQGALKSAQKDQDAAADLGASFERGCK